MKIQIDTVNKTIKLEESVNLNDLSEALNKLFPNNQWKEYKLETNTIINNWTNPIVIREYHNDYPWWRPYYSNPVVYMAGSSHDTGSLTSNPSQTIAGSNGITTVDNVAVYNVEY